MIEGVQALHQGAHAEDYERRCHDLLAALVARNGGVASISLEEMDEVRNGFIQLYIENGVNCYILRTAKDKIAKLQISSNDPQPDVVQIYRNGELLTQVRITK